MGKPFRAAFIPNEHVAELQAKHAGHLLGFAGIDASNARHDAVKETIRCVEQLGLKGIAPQPA
jgi:predicted TIM-barrel fold metal-dependent hydrolase